MTRIMTTLPDLPSPDEEQAAGRQDLAREIGDLVAQGKLEAAKEQLEATLNRSDLADIPPTPPEMTLEPQADASWKTRAMPLAEISSAETVADRPGAPSRRQACRTHRPAHRQTHRPTYRQTQHSKYRTHRWTRPAATPTAPSSGLRFSASNGSDFPPPRYLSPVSAGCC